MDMQNPQSTQALQLAKPYLTEEERDGWLQTVILAGELLKPGAPVLNDLALDLQMELYSELLEKVGQERFSAAYKSVLKTSKFRPDISELYEAAGVQVLNPHHEAALADLKLVIDRLRVHGPKRNQSWIDIKDLKKGKINATRLPESAERALAEVGWGGIKAGLAWVWQMPVLDQVRDGERHPMEDMPFRSQDKMQATWVQAWIKANNNATLTVSK